MKRPKRAKRDMTTLLINAMGGEGGGVLTGWIVEAARIQGLTVQATSVPGVAQRTGATTYYIEIAKPGPRGKMPVFALLPVAGQVDICLASELIEAGRAVAAGFITPDRTAVIASTHRVYTMAEKIAPGDGRIGGATIRDALASRSMAAVLIDLDVLARRCGVPIGAALLGALAGADILPIPQAAFEKAIREGGRAVDANLDAFDLAFDAARHEAPGMGSAGRAPVRRADSDTFPEEARPLIAAGVDRLIDYQGRGYARLYLRRLKPFAAGDSALCRELARELAKRMSYEDVIRVAQQKARPDRFRRIRGELGLDADTPFHVAEYLKPGLDELCDVLPWIVARPLLRLAGRVAWLRRVRVGMRMRSTTVWGYSRLWFLARLRLVRRITYRYGVEKAGIDEWLSLVGRATEGDVALAREITLLSGLIKGYSDTARHGWRNYRRILDEMAIPILDGELETTVPAAAIAAAREQALAEADDYHSDIYELV